MQPTDLCLTYAPIITLAVWLLKRLPVIGSKPKWIAFALSLALNTLGTSALHGAAVPLTELAKCVLTSGGLGIAAHETFLDKNGLWGMIRSFFF